LIARRAEEIAPFIVMEVLERARELERQGVDVIHLEVGEPDFDVPLAVKEATKKALDRGLTITPTAWGIWSYGRPFAGIMKRPMAFL
jgi:aspartate/methionine/tyrosine aminotransferase